MAFTVTGLLFLLSDACMHRLNSNARKVLFYVARQTLEDEGDSTAQLLRALHADLSRGAPSSVQHSATQEPWHGLFEEVDSKNSQFPVRFAQISLNQFCHGVRSQKSKGKGVYENRGTALSKSTV